MFLQLEHTKLEVYKFSQQLTPECYTVTKEFPSDERFALVQPIRRASMSVHLNLAEGCSLKSKDERRRFFEIARGSLIEVDTAVDISYKLGYVTLDRLKDLGAVIIKTFKLLTGMMK